MKRYKYCEMKGTLSARIKEKAEQEQKLKALAKKVKLRVDKLCIGDFVFIDAGRENLFGYAHSLNEAFTFLYKRFPQLQNL